jgi:hypothetical protein
MPNRPIGPENSVPVHMDSSFRVRHLPGLGGWGTVLSVRLRLRHILQRDGLLNSQLIHNQVGTEGTALKYARPESNLYSLLSVICGFSPHWHSHLSLVNFRRAELH